MHLVLTRLKFFPNDAPKRAFKRPFLLGNVPTQRVIDHRLIVTATCNAGAKPSQDIGVQSNRDAFFAWHFRLKPR